MKALSNIGILGMSIVLSAILFLNLSSHSDAYSQKNMKKYDMVIIGQNNITKGFIDEIDGEILNNGTATAKSVEITGIFFDDRGRIVGHESDGTSPNSIGPGERSAFAIKILDEAIKANATSYDFTVKWQDEHSLDYFTRSTGADIEDNSDNDDDDNDDDD